MHPSWTSSSPERTFALLGLTGALCVACGGSQTTTGSNGDGHGGRSGGASAGGALGTGGRPGNGGAGSGGATGSGGAAGATGAGGFVSCLDSSGKVDPTYRKCASDADCDTLRLAACCGSDSLVGVRRDACSLWRSECGALGCPKLDFDTAEDGQTTEKGGEIVATCVAGSCRTHLEVGAGVVCGALICAPDEVCVHPPTSVGGPAPQCTPPVDAGRCPSGTQYEVFCDGCVAIYDPGPPWCAWLPTACKGTASCACLPSAVCGGNANECQSVSGRDVLCVNLAP